MVEVITRAPESMFGIVSATLMSLAVLTLLPNKRLKLTGGDRSRGSGALCRTREVRSAALGAMHFRTTRAS